MNKPQRYRACPRKFWHTLPQPERGPALFLARLLALGRPRGLDSAADAIEQAERYAVRLACARFTVAESADRLRRIPRYGADRSEQARAQSLREKRARAVAFLAAHDAIPE